tara:strand:- start:17334 stop:17771 length:438 start_codon:yes stop_codon:yes gene_type:complete
MPTLSVTITETLNVNGKDRGNSVRVDVASVSEVIDRILTVDATEIEVLNFGAARGAGQIADSSLQYLRITNTAASGTCDLRFQDTANSKEFLVRIGAGESHLMFNSTLDANTGGDVDGSIALTNIDTIKAKASTSLDIEITAVST